jgi:purine-nucleoside phosphorylase
MAFLLENKDVMAPSVFTPENLLREARRQKDLKDCRVPAICILDPDGDLVEYLVEQHMALQNNCWACYHTKLYSFAMQDHTVGIIGNAVGSSFSVLVAEQLFVSGCELLISVTSAGIISPPNDGSRFVLITEALRDEGTSYHYLKAGAESTINFKLVPPLKEQFLRNDFPVTTGKSWTTDAPYRETGAAIEAARALGATCVEMEAAALYAFATAKNKLVVCFAHLTNTMAQADGDFEKGEFMGSLDTMQLVSLVVEVFSRSKNADTQNILSP